MLPVLMGIGGLRLTPGEEDLIRRCQPAGFVLFSRNIANPRQTRELTDSLRALCRHVPVIAVDQEGGRVVRTTALGLELPAASQIRRSGNIPALVKMAENIAISLRLLGFNMDLAPVLDICHDETVRNALPSRCWGTTPDEVVSMGGMFNRNLRHYGITTCAKHFPGMGLAQSDPHADLPTIDASREELLQSSLIPFMALEPELPAIMSAHILVPHLDANLPATLSHTIMTGLLRFQLGYKGVIMTDDLCMGAITNNYGVPQAADMALEAGCDLVLICHHAEEHLNEWHPRPSPQNGTDRDESLLRLERFSRALIPPLRWDDRLWEQCLHSAQNLVEEMQPFSSPASPSSPVQHM